jgi:coniferyl-aldehyde dehydrogenase
MRPTRRHSGWLFKSGRSRIVPQPLGVIGIVAPWNYPLLLAVGPLSAALAAGNRAMLKLSECTPCFGALLADVVRRNFADDEVLVINGDAQTARDFCALPFDHLLFTGSTAVGREVMRAASANLTPVTLELGGKSPVVIGPDADMRQAVARIMYGKLVNAGQTCIAPDYVLLPAGREAEFIGLARAAVQRLYPTLADRSGATWPADFTSVISDRHFARLEALLSEAAAAGGEIAPLAALAPDPLSRLMPPAIVTGAPPGCRIMQEEIFGPLLPLVGYRDIGEVIDYVNRRARPLALYVFARDKRWIAEVLAATVAGGVTVNDTLLHIAQNDLPFGGVGASGFGSYHGEFGFNTFSHRKAVFYQSRLNALALADPPYGKSVARLLKLMLR